MLFTRHVNGQQLHDPRAAKHRRLGHVLAALRRHGIRPVRAQLGAAMPDLFLKTNVDAVGVRATADGEEVVAIELKTTQHKLDAHRAELYDQACSRQPVLANGMPNSERTHHNLQIGFGVLCLKAALGRRFPVRGVVVMSYDAHADVHVMPGMYSSAAWFSGAAAAAVPLDKRPPPSARGAKGAPAKRAAVDDLCLPWPHDDARAARTAVLQEYSVVPSTAAPRCHAVGVVLSGGARGVAVCVNKPVSALRAAERKALRGVLLKSAAYIFGGAAGAGTEPTTHVLAPGKHRSWKLSELRGNHGV